MRRVPTFLAAALEPLKGSVWVLFVVWTVFVAGVWSLGISEAQTQALNVPGGLRDALLWFLKALDPVWFTLAATNAYLALVERVGLATARRWTLLVIISVSALTALNALFAFPLGPIRYTGRLGWKIGPVPCVLPLLWFAIILGAHALVAALPRRFSHAQVAVGAGLLSALSSINLEPLAWKFRALWVWFPARGAAPLSIPWQNYATWFAVGTLLAFALREPIARTTRQQLDWRPILILLLLNAVFLLTHLSGAVA